MSHFEEDTGSIGFAEELEKENPYYVKVMSRLFKNLRCRRNAKTKELLKTVKLSEFSSREEKVFKCRRFIDELNFNYDHNCLAYAVVSIFFFFFF